MGGDYYDREVISTSSINNQPNQEEYLIGKETKIHNSLKVLRWTDENLVSEHVNPIIFALDVTGSMGEWAKIIYNKMPMFYGQIMMQKYLTEPAISFCAIGDDKCDDEPLQVSEFGQGKEIDQLISKMVLQKSGGGNEHESYELAAYFYSTNVDLMKADMAFFFVTGDEGYWDVVEGATFLKVFGKGIKQQKLNSTEIWNKLMQKFNVFHIHKPYTSANYEKKIHKQWIDMLGEERVLDIVTPNACIDIILGAIALTSGKSLDDYIDDMKSRGQTSERIQEVTKALYNYNEKLQKGLIKPVYFKGSDKKTNIIIEPKVNNDNSINNNNLSHKININSEDIKEVVELAEKLLIEDLDEDTIKFSEELKALRKAKENQIPSEFICPLTKEIYLDPVLTCDGITFERKAIQIWLEKYDISPVTGQKIASKILLPNFALKQLIRDYYQSNK